MEIDESAVIAADPDAVWAVAGDPAAVAGWVPAIESATLDGDLRRAVFADEGGVAFERIVEHDDVARTYVYEYVSGPLALDHYRSRIRVEGDPQGAAVRWTAEFGAASDEVETELAAAIGEIYRAGLEELARRCATSTTS